MKILTLERLLDQKKPLSHLTFITFALVIVLIGFLRNKTENSVYALTTFFLFLLIQLEVFIFIARLIFREMNANITGREFTRIVLLRFVFFIVICFFSALIIFLTFRYAETLIFAEDISVIWRNFKLGAWIKSTLGGLAFGAIIFIIIQWQDALQREQKLREENLIFQNETLKNQVNPHFLFNSLNTVSSLIQSDPAKAESFINDLSSVYLYILENGQKDKVSLQAELDLITSFFDLHRVRDEEKIRLSIGCGDARNYQILPVSLQILVENAIKHNIATRENPLQISIYCEDQFIVVKNNLQKKATQLVSTKTGLKNLAERVRLISGKELIIEENDRNFIVKLPLSK